MEKSEIKSMRIKQMAFINGMLIAVFLIFILIINLFTISFAQFYLVMGILLLIQVVYGFIKGDSTKSVFPIIEKVAIYEKQKMGAEWKKQRKAGYFWQLMLGILIISQYFMHRNMPNDIFIFDYKFMLFMIVFLLIFGNISLLLHFRKVDTATSDVDLKGFTWKSNLVAILLGIIASIIMITGILYLVFNGLI